LERESREHKAEEGWAGAVEVIRTSQDFVLTPPEELEYQTPRIETPAVEKVERRSR
jgi:hypothetical protein